MSQIIVKQAGHAELPALVMLTRAAAIESGCEAIFDPQHATRHMQRVLDNGVAFIAQKDSSVIGTITCMPIDAGFAMLADLEATHTFVVPEARSYVAIAALFRQAEGYANERGLSILFHQCDYRAALAGHDGNGKRVERLYKARGFRGPVGVVYAAPQFARVGATYLFEGDGAGEAAAAQLPGVRRPNGRHE